MPIDPAAIEAAHRLLSYTPEGKSHFLYGADISLISRALLAAHREPERRWESIFRAGHDLNADGSPKCIPATSVQPLPSPVKMHCSMTPETVIPLTERQLKAGHPDEYTHNHPTPCRGYLYG